MLNRGNGVRSQSGWRLDAAPPRATTAILVATVCLTTIVAAELLDDGEATRRAEQSAVPSAIFQSSAAEGKSSSTGSVSANLQTVASKSLSRPLFADDRKLPAVPGQGPVATTAEPAVKLVGTIVSDRIRIAFLELGSKRIARMQGDSVGHRRIVGINQTRIALQAGDGQITEVGLSWGSFIAPTPRPSPLERSHHAFHLNE